MCGRLRCCLNYEYQQYREGRKGLPKKGKWVETPDGIGRVTVVLPLRGTVLVSIPGSGLHEYEGDVVTLTQRPQRPAQGAERTYNRPSAPRSPREEKVENAIPDHQLEELNAESVDINSQTTPVEPKPKQNRSRNSNNRNRSNNKKNNYRGRRNKNRSNKPNNKSSQSNSNTKQD
jgi:hypothetical protein